MSDFEWLDYFGERSTNGLLCGQEILVRYHLTNNEYCYYTVAKVTKLSSGYTLITPDSNSGKHNKEIVITHIAIIPGV